MFLFLNCVFAVIHVSAEAAPLLLTGSRSTDHGLPGDLWWKHRVWTQPPNCSRNWGPRHGPWKQHRSRHHYGLRMQHRLWASTWTSVINMGRGHQHTLCCHTWNHVDVHGPAAAAGDHTDLRGLHCHQRSWWWSWVMSRLVVLSRTMLRSVVLLQNFYFKTFLFFVNHVSYASGKSLNIQNVFFALWFPWVCMAPVRLSVFVISLKILGHT